MYYSYPVYYSPLDFLKKLGPVRGLSKRLFPDIVPAKEAHGIKSTAHKGIFVTGIHRSGTSWIGKIHSQANNVMYWREPFNPSTVKIMRRPYYYLSSSMEDLFYKKFTNELFTGKFAGALFDYTSPQQWVSRTHQRHLIKDPTAAFLIEWLTNNYNLDVVIVVRHPAGFVSSILNLKWDFDFNLILNQKQLMSDFLNPFKKTIEKHNYKGMDAAKGAVLWGIVYFVLEKMIKKYDFYWIKYEDICADPQAEFKQLFKAVNLNWENKIERMIQKSASSKVTFSDNITSKLKRDTTKMGTIWRDRLSVREIEIIDKLVKQFKTNLYEHYAK